MIVDGGKDAKSVGHPGTHIRRHLGTELQAKRTGEAHDLDIERRMKKMQECC
jgi:hypothetical protein